MHLTGGGVVIEEVRHPVIGEGRLRVSLPHSNPYGLDAGRQGLFVSLFEGDLVQVHPGGDTLSRIPLGYGLTHVVAAQGAVWVSSPQEGEVWRVEAHGDDSNAAATVLRRTGNRSCPQGSDSSPSAIWIADPCAGLVWLLDPRDGEVLGKVSDVGERPVDVDVSRGWAWIMSMRDRVVTAVDAKKLTTVGRGKAGKGALTILSQGHQAWVTNTENHSLTYLWTEGDPINGEAE